ncbi:all-trans retinoic acid-induced differentiation factor isoform X2 [Struthio camelus]|uniref:all-trans retinoic acid-induced differentiation factor isoform X2 n=1 Tax=Struthio camelus TaxID=8801 RepID=UPI003603C2F7
MAARLLLLLLLPLLPRAAGTVCGCCPGPLGNGSAVGRYCAGRAGAEPRGRCCLAGGAQPGRIVGLDLSNCSLRSLPPGLPEAAGAIVLDLTENPLATLPNSSFRGFTRLQSLAVPPWLQCPGGSGAWQQDTTHGSRRLCRGQRNPCNSSGELGRLPRAALRRRAGHRGGRPLPAALEHPAPQGQDTLSGEPGRHRSLAPVGGGGGWGGREGGGE